MQVINAQTIINTLKAAALVAPSENDKGPFQKIKIQTSARGYFMLQNTREKLEAMAATVKSKAAYFGGGLDKPARRAAPAVTWSAQALKVARELIESRDYAGALDLGADKLGALFYLNDKARGEKTSFAIFAPVPCEAPELAGLYSGMLESGAYTVFDLVSGVGINGTRAQRTRAGAIAAALERVADKPAEFIAHAIKRAQANYKHAQAEALAQWKSERGLMSADEIEAHAARMLALHNEREAAEAARAAAHTDALRAELEAERAQEAAQAQAAAIVADAMAEPAPVELQAAQVATEARELETVSASRDISGQAWGWNATLSAAPGGYALEYQAIGGGTLQSTHATRRERAAALRALTRQDINQWEALQSGEAKPGKMGDMLQALRAVQSTTQAAPEAPKPRASRSIDNGHDSGGADWCAVLKTTPGGAFSLRFMGDGGAWEPTTEHATRRERAAALRRLVQKNADNVAGFDDTPEDGAPDVVSMTTEAAQAMPPEDYARALVALESINFHNEALLLRAMRTGIDSLVQSGRLLVATHAAQGYNNAACLDIARSLSHALSLIEGARLERAALEARAQLARADHGQAPRLSTTPEAAAPTVDNPAPDGQAAADFAGTLPPSPPADAGLHQAPPFQTGGLHDTPRDLGPNLAGPKPKKPSIDSMRRVIESCNWSRNDLGGATRQEFIATDVPARLGRHIEAVRALQIPPRFARDIEAQAEAIERALKTIARWHAMQPGAVDNPAPTTQAAPTLAGTPPPSPPADAGLHQAPPFQTGALHDTPRDLAQKTPEGFTKLPAQAVGLAELLATGSARRIDLLGMGVTGAEGQEGAIVTLHGDGPHLAAAVVTEDGKLHQDIPGAAFGPGGAWRFNLKKHGRPYLVQLRAAQALNKAQTQAQASAANPAGAIMPPMQTTATTTPEATPANMTGAELQTLRETCGLTRDELATLADVQARTVKHWETRPGGVPADVARLISELESAMRQAVIAQTEAALLAHAPRGKDTPVILVRYREAQDIPAAAWGTMPPSMQGAAILRIRLALLSRGYLVRVIWHDADCTDPHETLTRQASGHRADQPPQA
jgi:DNA-binding transcriptional regulator YiaG